MKFRIYLETNSPAEKTLTPILNIDISSENAAPHVICDVLNSASAMLWELNRAMKEKRQLPS